MSQSSRIFTIADQQWFRQVSGDANPLHVDPVWAATTYPGELVVHGIHVLLWALEKYLGERPEFVLVGVQATFVQPVVVGDEVTSEVSEDGLMVRLIVQNAPMVVVRLSQRTSGDIHDPGIQFAGALPTEPFERSFESLKQLQGEVMAPPGAAALSTAFPAVTRALGSEMLAGLASLSTLVGMECPGLRSLLSELSVIRTPSAPAAALVYWVKKLDPIFGRVHISIEGLGLAGTVLAYAGRVDTPPSDDDIRSLVSPGEFAGTRPLVVGASGGLGAATARLLSAGGATPVLTWHQSRTRAEATARSVENFGGRCELMQLDSGAPEPGLATLAEAQWGGRQVYYFATPRIFRRHLDLYQGTDLRVFLDLYVDGFYTLVRGLLRARGSVPLRVFYPSTIAITDPTPDLLEYSMAKLAGELLCARLQKKYKTLSIISARLPRIATRQTQSFMYQSAESPHHVMLPFVRAMQESG